MTEYQAKQTLLTNENKHKKYKQKPDRTQNVTGGEDEGSIVKSKITVRGNLKPPKAAKRV